MKKALSLCVVFAAVVFIFSVGGMTVFAESATNGMCGDDLTWSFNSSTGSLNITGSGDMTSVPWKDYLSKIKSVKFYANINSIYEGAFKRSSVESVTIPDSVTSIGKEAFFECKSLNSVKLGNNVREVGNAAFGDCVNVDYIEIPASVEKIGEWAFSGCSASTVVFDSGSKLKTIDRGGFSECSFQSISLPDSVENLGSGVFMRCKELSSISFGENPKIESITESMFEYSGIQSIEVPDSVKIVDDFAFHASGLKSISFGKNSKATSIKSSAFWQCYSLQKVTLPDSLEEIGSYAFDSCEKLGRITFGKGLKKIGFSAFCDCHLESISLPDSMETIDGGAFSYSGLSQVDFGNGLKTIASGAFSNCHLTELNIPDSVMSIGKNAFYYNIQLKNVYFGKNSQLAETVEIFPECTALESVTFGDNLVTVGENTFMGCSSLKTVNLGNNLKTIGKDAFSGCTGLEELDIPDSVTSIGTSFAGNKNLRHVNLGVNSNLTAIEIGTFQECAKLESIVIPNKVTSIGALAFADCSSLKDVTIGTNVAEIGNGAFANCPAIASVHYMGSNLDWEELIKNIASGNEDLTSAAITFEQVYPDGEPISISVTCKPYKTVYHLGDTLDTNGLCITANYGEGLSCSMTRGFTCTPMHLNKLGTQEIKVNYKGAVTTFSVTVVGKLEILTQPTSVTAKDGDSIKFTVAASGEGLTYRWQLSDDQGKTWRNSSIKTATYYITLNSTNSGRYVRCVVTDKYGNSVKSNAAYMKVTSLKITGQPTSVTANKGATVSFRVTASGPNITYQWQLSDDQGKTWRNSSVKTANYSTTLSSTNSGRYVRCVVTDKYGNSVKSNAAYMKVTSLKITGQPTSVTANKGATVSFKVTASGPSITYQWQLSDDQGKTWRNSSVKIANYSITLSSTNSGRYVRCVVTDKYGNSVKSNAAYMKVTSLKITGQPTSVTANKGATVSFKVTASGPGITYQWQLSDDQGKTWRNSSVKTANYSTTLSSTNSGRYVRCVVTDKYGNSVKSNAAYMKVTSLKITGQPTSVTAKKGAAVSFKVTASGPNITYQWQLSDDQGKTWRNSSVKTANYSTTLSSTNNGRYLRCIVTDKYGNRIASNAAYMKIK